MSSEKCSLTFVIDGCVCRRKMVEAGPFSTSILASIYPYSLDTCEYMYIYIHTYYIVCYTHYLYVK